jgi:hypothetical protein
MARIRSIHYNACKSEKLDAASAEAERCYWRLLPHCDDEGRAEDDSRNLRSLMFPVAEPPLPAQMVDGWLGELHDLGLIVRYTVDGRGYLQVTRWADFQKPQHPKASDFPTIPEDFSTPHESSGSGVPGVGEGEGEGEGERSVELALVPQAALRPSLEERVFCEWQTATNHPNAKLTEDRKRVIERARKWGYDEADMIDACRGILLSPHHRGENDRHTVYDDITTVLKSGKNVETFRDLYRGCGPRAPNIVPKSLGAVHALAREVIDA